MSRQEQPLFPYFQQTDKGIRGGNQSKILATKGTQDEKNYICLTMPILIF